MIVVANKRTSPAGEYIGRPSPLGNPFAIGRDGTREEVIAKYSEWLTRAISPGVNRAARDEFTRLWRKAKAGEDLTLVCWCAPKACHGDVIKQRLESFL